jgi:hypothetical protein
MVIFLCINIIDGIQMSNICETLKRTVKNLIKHKKRLIGIRLSLTNAALLLRIFSPKL